MDATSQGAAKRQSRRQALISLFMWGGLVLSYGTGLFFALRYVYPRRAQRRLRTVFFAPAADLPSGTSKTYTLPDGNQALVTNTGVEVVALSNICPHLGCKVHWEARNQRFFCPCHGGVFGSRGCQWRNGKKSTSSIESVMGRASDREELATDLQVAPEPI